MDEPAIASERMSTMHPIIVWKQFRALDASCAKSHHLIRRMYTQTMGSVLLSYPALFVLKLVALHFYSSLATD
jgi:hypothetical protein